MVVIHKKERIKYIFSIIGVFIFLVFTTGFIYLPKQDKLLSSLAFVHNLKSFYMEDLSSGILLKDAIPVLDTVGSEYEPYQFKVVNNSDLEVTYHIVFRKKEMNLQEKEILPNHYLRFSLKSEGTTLVDPTTLPENGILYVTTIKAHSQQTFEFRMWLDWDSDNEAMDKIFMGKVEIEKLN